MAGTLANPTLPLLWLCGKLIAAPPTGSVHSGPDHSVREIVRQGGIVYNVEALRTRSRKRKAIRLFALTRDHLSLMTHRSRSTLT